MRACSGAEKYSLRAADVNPGQSIVFSGSFPDSCTAIKIMLFYHLVGASDQSQAECLAKVPAVTPETLARMITAGDETGPERIANRGHHRRNLGGFPRWRR